jgi:hypothetical protein
MSLSLDPWEAELQLVLNEVKGSDIKSREYPRSTCADLLAQALAESVVHELSRPVPPSVRGALHFTR